MLSIAICDDEAEEIQKIRTIIEEYLLKHAIIYSLHVFASGEAILKADMQFDFVFLDIAMKGMNGVEVGIKLYQRSMKLKIVYITCFNEYWEDAINQAHAFAYLSKPIKKDKLLKQVCELINEVGTDKGNDVEIELKNVKKIGASCIL